MWRPNWRLELEALLALRSARLQVERCSVGQLAAAVEATVVGAHATSRDAVVDAFRKAIGSRFAPRETTCLPRALGLTRLLRRHGHDATLVIGVRPEDLGARGIEDGHAWVELSGEPVDEPAGKIETYREFLRAPRATAEGPDGSTKGESP